MSMCTRTYEGNKSLKGMTKVTAALKMKIRRLANRFDDEKDNILFVSGEYYGGDLDIDFLYFNHDIFARIRDSIVTVYEFDYYGNYLWSCESRELGTFQF